MSEVADPTAIRQVGAKDRPESVVALGATRACGTPPAGDRIAGIVMIMRRGEDDELEGEFPLGDGTAETDAVVVCPCCGEAMEIALDPGGGAVQAYVEDCQVCCRPWRVSVRYDAGGRADVSVTALEE